MSFYCEEDILQWLSHAQAELLVALSHGDEALNQFQAQWDRVRASVDSDPSLQTSTLALSHTVGISIAHIVEVMLEQESSTHTIEEELTKDLLAGLERRQLPQPSDAAKDLEPRCVNIQLLSCPIVTHGSRSSSPLPPYIEPCYKWLVNHLENPYPTKSTKEQLLQQTRLSMRSEAADSITLAEIEEWFLAARARIGWGDVRRRIFDGSRALMLQATRHMWGDHQDSSKFMAGCVSSRKAGATSLLASRNNHQNIQADLRSAYDVVAFKVEYTNDSSVTREESLHPSPAPALRPDVELALAGLEVNAREMYGLEPTELADSLETSGVDRVSDVTTVKTALAAASAERQRQARREQRQAKKAKTEARQRAEDRKCYPSPEPPSADELSSSASDEDLDGFNASDSEDEEDFDGPPSELMAQMYPQLVPTASIGSDLFARRSSELWREHFADDEDSDDDSSSESSDGDSEGSGSGSDDDSDDEEVYEEQPEQLAGTKRSRDVDDDGHVLKKPRLLSPPVPRRPRAICTYLPSPTPSSRGSSPSSPVSPLSCSMETAHGSGRVNSPTARPKQISTAVCKSLSMREELRRAGLSLPFTPILMGSDGVPLGTVRSKRPRPSTTSASVSVQPSACRARVASQSGIKVNGDPTPWVNWNLDALTPEDTVVYSSPPQCSSISSNVPSTDHRVDNPAVPSLSRSASVSFMSSACSSSESSDTASLFSNASDGTDATDPDEPVFSDEARPASVDSSHSPSWRESSPDLPPAGTDVLFDPYVWSQYDLSPPSDGEFHSSSGDHGASAFVPTKFDIQPAKLAPLPIRRRDASMRPPSRLVLSTAEPVVSYQQAVGTITSPRLSSFGQGQLTGALAVGEKAGNSRRKTPVKRRRPPSPSAKARQAAPPSALAEDILSSGLLDDISKASLSGFQRVTKAKSTTLDDRSSKSTTNALPRERAVDLLRARLLEIEQQAARLEAERRALEQIASTAG
ncbi:mating-type protein A-alpha Z4 [Schizophyllum fasciatum]